MCRDRQTDRPDEKQYSQYSSQKARSRKTSQTDAIKYPYISKVIVLLSVSEFMRSKIVLIRKTMCSWPTLQQMSSKLEVSEFRLWSCGWGGPPCINELAWASVAVNCRNHSLVVALYCWTVLTDHALWRADSRPIVIASRRPIRCRCTCKQRQILQIRYSARHASTAFCRRLSVQRTRSSATA